MVCRNGRREKHLPDSFVPYYREDDAGSTLKEEQSDPDSATASICGSFEIRTNVE